MTTNTTTQSQTSELVMGRDWLRLFAILLTLAGIAISGYLSYTHFADKELLCVESGSLDCNAVQASAYSEIMGIPIAVLGLGAYISFFLLLVLEPFVPLVDIYGRTLLFGLTLFGVLYSAYLTYIEAFVLEKWCQYCVASAIIMVVLFGIATWRAVMVFEDEEGDF